MKPLRIQGKHQPSAGSGVGRSGRSCSTLLHMPVVLGVLVLLALFLSACASEEEAETGLADTQELEESISEAERRGEELPEHPATFISLCVNCHDELDRELDWRRQRKLIFNHQVHFANNIRCAACHHEFPHKPGYTIHVDVETCFLCHGRMHGAQGKLAPTECDVCHTADIEQTTPDHEEEDWRFVAGAEKAEHSRQALDRRLYCRMCHEDQFCLDCHEVSMPHPEEWLAGAHEKVSDRERASCSACHRDSVFCNECHHIAYREVADWRTQHKSEVRRQSADSCYRCHSVPSCAECHVMTSRERGVWSD